MAGSPAGSLLGDSGFQKRRGLVGRLAWPRAGESGVSEGPAATMPRGVGTAQLCVLVLALQGWTRSKYGGGGRRGLWRWMGWGTWGSGGHPCNSSGLRPRPLPAWEPLLCSHVARPGWCWRCGRSEQAESGRSHPGFPPSLFSCFSAFGFSFRCFLSLSSFLQSLSVCL